MYHIIEIQSYNHKDEATGQLYYAYSSKVDMHTVAILDHTGAVIESECVYHGQERSDAE